MGQGRHRYAWTDESRRAGARHAELPTARTRSSENALRAGLFARHAAAGRSRGLSDAVARGFGRRVPSRKPRADVDAAAIETAVFLRPRHRGRDRPAGTDPGRHAASLLSAPRRHREGILPLAVSSPWTV